MDIKITNLTNGHYDILGNNLYFNDGESDIIICKNAGLEIMRTLIDSINLLDNNAEDLICKIENILDTED